MPIKSIDEISLENKRVFIRADFNVPIRPDGTVADDLRILSLLPTLSYSLKKKAIVIVASHLGRPEGKKVKLLSLAPVAKRLMELLEIPEVIFPENCVGDGVRKLSTELKPGELMLLENLRFHKGEEANEEHFSKQLASLCDVYINDAFGTAHRAHASTVGMVSFVKEKGMGFLMKRELKFLEKVISNPERPFVAILGGAKVSDKIGVIENLLNYVDSIAVGGAMAYTFLKAQGVLVGGSRVEEEKLFVAKKILKRANTKGVPFLLPLDHQIAQKPEPASPVKTIDTQGIPKEWIGVDIGPKTVESIGQMVEKAKTVFWNGPLGVYEIEKFAQGTYSVAERIALLNNATTIIGGGDSATVLRRLGLEDKVTHLSTGGGASLKFIEGAKLPGIKALES